MGNSQSNVLLNYTGDSSSQTFSYLSNTGNYSIKFMFSIVYKTELKKTYTLNIRRDDVVIYTSFLLPDSTCDKLTNVFTYSNDVSPHDYIIQTDAPLECNSVILVSVKENSYMVSNPYNFIGSINNSMIYYLIGVGVAVATIGVYVMNKNRNPYRRRI